VRNDAAGKHGLTPLTKCTTTMRMLVYGITVDCVDEYLKIGASTAMECIKKFTLGVIEVFGDEYLRKPNQTDVARLLQVAEARDFFSMLGSINCMHGSRRIVQRLKRHYFKSKLTMCQLSFLKPLHHTAFGYSMLIPPASARLLQCSFNIDSTETKCSLSSFKPL